MNTPFNLTIDAARAGAIKAYKDNRLGFQNGEFQGQYVYGKDKNGGMIGCGIGVSLPISVLDKIADIELETSDYLVVGDLVERGILSSDDYHELTVLQELHDAALKDFYAVKIFEDYLGV